LRGIEQLFLFDSFMDERIKEGGAFWSTSDRGIAPPRMVDTFLSSNEFLLQWWLEEERDGIISSLRQCAVTTLSSYLSHKEEDGPDEGMETSAGATTQQQLYPPISELFVALLHSARCKSNIFLDQRSRQMYLANVIAPLCSEYLDMVHSEAASLRKKNACSSSHLWTGRERPPLRQSPIQRTFDFEHDGLGESYHWYASRSASSPGLGRTTRFP